MSSWSRIVSKESALWNLPQDYLENIELGTKLVLFPELLFNRSFSRESQPYQDMALLIKIRNGFVHFKMKPLPPKFLKTLDQRGISITAKHVPDDADFAWTQKLSSSEGIRWAHNTVCKIIQGLAQFASDNRLENDPFLSLANYFKEIPDAYPREWLSERGIDPESGTP